MASGRSWKSDKERRLGASDLDSDSGDDGVTWLDFAPPLSFGHFPRERGKTGAPGAGRRGFAKASIEEEFEEFWKRCDEIAVLGREPDWEVHLKTINESRMRGLVDD